MSRAPRPATAAGERPWRCFVAVPIPDDLRSAIATAVDAMRRHPSAADWRWTDAAGWHLTLAFLGARPPDRVPVIGAALREVAAAMEPFTASAGGWGAFPSRGAARVLWYGIDDRDGRLHVLAAAARAAAGVEEEAGGFRAHLTVARARNGHERPAAELVEAVASPSATLPVADLALMRSHLGGGPARYETLMTAPLGTGARLAATVRGR